MTIVEVRGGELHIRKIHKVGEIIRLRPLQNNAPGDIISHNYTITNIRPERIELQRGPTTPFNRPQTIVLNEGSLAGLYLGLAA